MLAMSGTDCRMTRMIRARGSTAMHTCTRRSALWHSLSGVPLGPSHAPPPHLPPTCPEGQRRSPPHLSPGIQTGALLFPRVPSSPEGIGDSVDIEFANEQPQEQGKDDKEVEDVPAVLGVVGDGEVGQPQWCLSDPGRGDILGLPSHHPKDGGAQCSSQGRTSHLLSTAVISPAAPKCATKYTGTRCLLCMSTAKCILGDTRWRLSYTQLIPKLSTGLGQCSAENGPDLQLGDRRGFGHSRLCVTHATINNKMKINTKKTIKEYSFGSQFRREFLQALCPARNKAIEE